MNGKYLQPSRKAGPTLLMVSAKPIQRPATTFLEKGIKVSQIHEERIMTDRKVQ